MKKRIVNLILSVALLVGCMMPTTAFANEISVTLNGQYISFDQPPVMINDRVLVPVRAIFEAMGFTVLWNEETQIINVATEFGMMTLGIGSPYISYRNETENKSIVTDVPPQIINGRTLVPARAIAECTGYNVDWNDATQTVLITGDSFGITLPEANIAGYYANTKVPDFGACCGMALTKHNDLENTVEYCYNDVTGKQVIEYIETYLASVGFIIDDEQEIFGMFRFSLSNTSTGEWVRVSYSQSNKSLFVTVGK